MSAVVVAVRLHAARRDLASAFIERAYTAEREADWAQAAAYFAAARVQRDTPEARWGVALAGERRHRAHPLAAWAAGVVHRRGRATDGRIIVLGLPSDRDGGAGAREREDPVVLVLRARPWCPTAAGWPDPTWARGAAGRTSMARPEKSWPRTTARPSAGPVRGPYPREGVPDEGSCSSERRRDRSRPVATAFGAGWRCVVSDDGLQVAYEDAFGNVQLLAVDDGHTLASRPGAGLRDILFSRHGLVLVKVGRLEVFGGQEGDFTIELPEGGFGDSRVQNGSSVSPDGHLVAVPRLGSNRSDVVDLRSRSIRATLTHAPGWARLAFSLDGQRVFAADLHNGATLNGWRLPPPEVPTHHAGSWEIPVIFSSSGRLLYLADHRTSQYELYGPGDELLARRPHSVDVANRPELAGDRPVGAFWDNGKGESMVLDYEQGRVLWARPCRICMGVGISADGSRVVHIGPVDRLEVWDTQANRLLFKEVERVGPRQDAHCNLSPDGRRVAWSQGRTVIVRDLDSGKELELPYGVVSGFASVLTWPGW